MELDSAARHRLLDEPPVTGYVVRKVFKFRLMEALQGSGGRAVVVKREGGWSQPDQARTVEYPLLIVQCWADPDRENGELSVGNAEEKAWALWRTVDPCFHMVRGARWGLSTDPPRDGLMIVRSSRWSEPRCETSSSSLSDRGASLERNLLTDGGAYVECSYAVELAHGTYN